MSSQNLTLAFIDNIFLHVSYIFCETHCTLVWYLAQSKTHVIDGLCPDILCGLQCSS